MSTIFTPGQWYLTVTCFGCKERVIVSRDLNNGHAFSVGRHYVVCPHCEMDRYYKSDQVEEYQQPN